MSNVASCHETQLLTSYQSFAVFHLYLFFLFFFLFFFCLMINFLEEIFAPKLVSIGDCLTVEIMDFFHGGATAAALVLRLSNPNRGDRNTKRLYNQIINPLRSENKMAAPPSHSSVCLRLDHAQMVPTTEQQQFRLQRKRLHAGFGVTTDTRRRWRTSVNT